MIKSCVCAAVFAVALAANGTGASAATTAGVTSGNECGKGGFSSCELEGFDAVIKFDAKGVEEISKNYSTMNGGEFTLTYITESSGTWSYSPEFGDPELFRLVAKAGNQSLTFDISNLISGEWQTPDGKEMSHITFFGEQVAPVPLPAAGLLLVGALAGLGAFKVRRRANVAF